MPSLFSLLRTMFADETQRRLAIGIMLSSFSVGTAIGPLLGGALLEYFWWGSVFLINIPFMALLVLLGKWFLPERAERNTARIDLPSVLLSMTGILAVIYGLQELAAGQETGEGSVLPNLAIACAGVLLLGVFVRRQHRLTEPLFDLTLLRSPQVAASLGSLPLVYLSVLGIYFLLTQYLQLVVGLSPLLAGVATVPYAVINIVGAVLAPELAKRWRPAVLVALGLGIAAAGAVLLAVTVGPSTPIVLIVAAISVVGFGQGVAFALIVDLIISSAPSEKTGSVSAAQEVSAELGGALGIAAGGAVGTVVYRARLEQSMPSEVPEAAAETALSSLHGGVGAVDELSYGGPALLEAVHEAISTGLQTFAIIAAIGVALATLLVTVVLVLRDRPHHHRGGDSSAQEQRRDEGVGPKSGSVPVKQPVQAEHDALSGQNER